MPASWLQRLEITSLTFMLNWVPLPVIQTCSGNMSSCGAGQDLVADPGDQTVVLVVEPAHGAVGIGRRFLQDGVGGDHLPRDQIAADAEMLQRALGLGAPELVRRHLHRTQAVGFFAEFRHSVFSVMRLVTPPLDSDRPGTIPGRAGCGPEPVSSCRRRFRSWDPGTACARRVCGRS